MLSVERLEPYAGELGLPFDAGRHADASRLARACLEVEISGTAEARGHSPLGRAWADYRAAEGVVGDERIVELRAGKAPLKLAFDVFVERGGWVGEELYARLVEWFAS